MGATTAVISLDRFRRRRTADAQVADQLGSAAATHPLSGLALGVIERRYGLMCSEERIVIGEVIATSGDLAVADRLAFVAAMERHTSVAVVEFDGWFVACTTERAIAPDEARELRPLEDSPRLMSMVGERGITPVLGPLGA